MPVSFARRRIAGEVRTFAECPASVLTDSVGIAGPDAGRNAPEAASADGFAISTTAVSATDRAISSAPTATMSPGSPLVRSTSPETGAGTSTLALSVITSAMMSPSATTSPGCTCHSTISTSTVPSPRSGSLNTYSLIRLPSPPRARPRRASGRENTPTRRRAGMGYPSRLPG